MLCYKRGARRYNFASRFNSFGFLVMRKEALYQRPEERWALNAIAILNNETNHKIKPAHCHVPAVVS